ncbi:MAG: hypothetical protein LC792_18495 [Actinobacteria bacterium]|nr:hypothetical protein [Actinomycetota bacterium]
MVERRPLRSLGGGVEGGAEAEVEGGEGEVEGGGEVCGGTSWAVGALAGGGASAVWAGAGAASIPAAPVRMPLSMVAPRNDLILGRRLVGPMVLSVPPGRRSVRLYHCARTRGKRGGFTAWAGW